MNNLFARYGNVPGADILCKSRYPVLYCQSIFLRWYIDVSLLLFPETFDLATNRGQKEQQYLRKEAVFARPHHVR